MAVDIARRPYTTRARFFVNDDREIKIKWLPADPARGTFPGVSRVCSLDWVTHPETAEGVGEVFGAPRSFNRGKPFVGIEGNHFCGTLDEHRNGEVFDPSRPEMKYNPSGLPLCCDPSRREAYGSVSIKSGSVTVTSNPYRSYRSVAVRHVSIRIHDDPFRITRYTTSDSGVSIIVSDAYVTAGLVAIKSASESLETIREYRTDGLVAIKSASTAETLPPPDVSGDHQSCETAYPSLAYETLLPWDITHVGYTYFLLPYDVAGAVNHLRLLLREPRSLSFVLYKGTCGSLESVPLTQPYDWRFQWTQPEDGQLLLALITDQTHVREETFEVFQGPAPDPMFSTP